MVAASSRRSASPTVACTPCSRPPCCSRCVPSWHSRHSSGAPTASATGEAVGSGGTLQDPSHAFAGGSPGAGSPVRRSAQGTPCGLAASAALQAERAELFGDSADESTGGPIAGRDSSALATAQSSEAAAALGGRHSTCHLASLAAPVAADQQQLRARVHLQR